jgi:hypothetical protein
MGHHRSVTVDHHAVVVAPVAVLISHIATAVLEETAHTHITMVVLEETPHTHITMVMLDEDEDEEADTHVTIVTLEDREADPETSAATPVMTAMVVLTQKSTRSGGTSSIRTPRMMDLAVASSPALT